MPHKKKAPPSTDRLNEVLAAIHAAAEATGWGATTSHVDEKNRLYASVAVNRGRYTAHEVEGLIDVGLDEGGARFQIHKTSFYGTGLEQLRDAIRAHLQRLPWLESSKPKPPQPDTQAHGATVVGVLSRFDQVVRQLSRVKDGAGGFQIESERDVQDILHAVLRGLADDVRPEEFAPSYAGASSRMDFLIKQFGIVVEAKLASEKLRDKQVGEELLVDIQRYQTHPDARMLVCLVYDPQNMIRNPAGLEADLSGRKDKMDVRVIVTPK